MTPQLPWRRPMPLLLVGITTRGLEHVGFAESSEQLKGVDEFTELLERRALVIVERVQVGAQFDSPTCSLFDCLRGLGE